MGFVVKPDAVESEVDMCELMDFSIEHIIIEPKQRSLKAEYTLECVKICGIFTANMKHKRN